MQPWRPGCSDEPWPAPVLLPCQRTVSRSGGFANEIGGDDVRREMLSAAPDWLAVWLAPNGCVQVDAMELPDRLSD